ncbi:MAG TPA: DUF5916 domain-containing protein, partial [Kofleriaceae bacterium]|nr:DUF5916 domain-containing protein [Kofleriaceae bacterium]
EAPFYSRRIGRPPEGAVPAGATAPSATTIAGAAKVYGRTDDGWRGGLLATSTLGATASDGTVVAVPEQAVIARVVKESADGDRAAGAFASELHRDGDIGLPRDDGAFGVDARLRWDDQTYETRAWALGTEQRGSAAAIAALAARPWHDLDRVDAPRLRLADDATTLTGGAAEIRLAKVGGDLQGSLAARAISPGFDIDALGFQRNSDWFVLAAQLQRQWTPNTDWIHTWRIGTDNAGLGWSWGGERRAAVIDGFASAVFSSYADTTVTLQHEASVLSTEWLRGGPALALPPRETARLSAHTDTRRQTVAGIDAAAAVEPGSGSHDVSLAPSLTWRLSNHVAGIASASYDDQRIGWQYIGPDLVGRVHQRTAAASLQVDVALSPRMIVQLYAQPFVSTGSYDNYATVVDAHAGRFAAVDPDTLGIARPDGSHRSLIASAIARWEIRPGSFLTAVWNHHGEAVAPVAPLTGEFGRVLHEAGSDLVLVKLAWRFAL